MPTEAVVSTPSLGDEAAIVEGNAASSSSVKCSLCMACLTPDDVISPTGNGAEGGTSSSVVDEARTVGLSSVEDEPARHGEGTERPLGQEGDAVGLRRVLTEEVESLLCGRCNELRSRVTSSSRPRSRSRPITLRNASRVTVIDAERRALPQPITTGLTASEVRLQDEEEYDAIPLMDGFMLSPRRRRADTNSVESPVAPEASPGCGITPDLEGEGGSSVLGVGGSRPVPIAHRSGRMLGGHSLSGDGSMELGLGLYDEVDSVDGTSRSARTFGRLSLSEGATTVDTMVLTPPDSLDPYTTHPPPQKGRQTRPAPLDIHPPVPSVANEFPPSPPGQSTRQPERPPNPYLDFGVSRCDSRGRGSLFPGSFFRGTQTSGRSSYDVEVRIIDVSFAESTLSGYLSICHLTDSHPLLTTFFTGEIIGPKFGFLTGPNYYARATEQDDMRHWGRFEHYRKVKNDLQRPGLTVRDPASTIEGKGMERPFAFMRWKERFLVPDHKVRDISGASFAGFYYLQIDFDPPANYVPSRTTTTVNTIPGRPTTPRRSSSSQSRPPPANRRLSNPIGSPDQADLGILALPPVLSPPTSPSIPEVEESRTTVLPAPSLRRQQTPESGAAGARARSTFKKPKTQATTGPPVLTGYYFHHQNSELFQELCLHHVPERGSGSFELR